MALTKQDIVDAIRARTGVSGTDAITTAETVLKVIKDTLASGEDVLISGFGKFQLNKKAARKGRNPYTGEPITLKPRRVLTFKVAAALRERVNNGGADIE